MSLTTTIKTIQDIMRKDVGVDGDAQRIGQLVWMLFLKILDEREKGWETKRGYVSPLQNGLRWRDWAAPRKEKGRRTGDKLIAFVNQELFPKLKNLHKSRGGTNGLRTVISAVFEDALNHMKSGALLREVIDKIEEGIHFESMKDREHLGDIYEKILRDLQNAGNAGEFYTPRAVTQFAVDRLAPTADDTILDPACGTGGFLADSINFISERQTGTMDAPGKLENAIHGYELKPLPHMLAVTNMILHGIDTPENIHHEDTLRLYKTWSRRYSIVMTNPPFGGVVQDGTEADFPKDSQAKETADLFLFFIIDKMLADDGRCAVVLPDGFLFGEGAKSRLKEKLTTECNLHTIVRLPNGVFNPYTGIKTNILFFRKGKPTRTTWYFEHPYPEGYKNYSKTRPMRFEEFAAEQAWWGSESDDFAERRETQHAWKIDFESERADALARAQPHYDKSEAFAKELESANIELRSILQETRELNSQLRDRTLGKQKRQALTLRIAACESQSKELREKAVTLERSFKDERAAAERIKYSVYNLDRKNPNTTVLQADDPDKLLERYLKLQEAVAEIRERLKSELAAALLREAD
jgi:type I restriction enzyme M protein